VQSVKVADISLGKSDKIWRRSVMSITDKSRRRSGMKEWSKALKNLSILTQLGLSLIMPLLLCLFLVYRLREVFSLGYWIYIPAFFFGLGGSCVTAYKVYLSVCKKEEEEKRSKDKAFNEHKS